MYIGEQQLCSNMAENRRDIATKGVPLNVTFSQKQWAKDQGAHWDKDDKVWRLHLDSAKLLPKDRWHSSVQCYWTEVPIKEPSVVTHFWSGNAFTGGNGWTLDSGLNA